MRTTPLAHLLVFACAALAATALGVATFYRSAELADDVAASTPSPLERTWEAYRHTFLVAGRVIRPTRDNDTVSEGQAYAMLRAVWIDDQDTFDACYQWTEAHLSRQDRFGDHLLAWHYGRVPGKAYQVLDWNAAADADLDYALALLLADRRWGRPTIGALDAYRKKALAVAADILRLEVTELANGELLLLPWPNTDSGVEPPFLINASYFSPGHYHAFAQATGDERWTRLASSTYAQLDRLTASLGDTPGVGLVPDWSRITAAGRFRPSPKRGTAASWDAFRIWWRLRLDLELSGSAKARRLLRGHLIPFLRRTLDGRDPRVHIEYDYDGSVRNPYESPAALGLYAWSLDGLAPGIAGVLRQRLGEYRLQSGGLYEPVDDYYVNSWAWWGEAVGPRHCPVAPVPSILRKEGP